MIRSILVVSFISLSVFLLFSCNNQQKKTDVIRLKINNLPIDSCSIRINHIITGREIFHIDRVSLADTIKLPVLVDDFYIIGISWPKTYISHTIFRSKGFDREQGQDIFEITKPFYFNHNNGNVYIINVANKVNLEQLESKGGQVLHFENQNCSDCNLADRYWSAYNSFFERKTQKIDSIKQRYYQAIEFNELNRADSIYKSLITFESSFNNDEILDKQIIDFIDSNKESPISTFFLFYQLYQHKDFSKYKPSFNYLQRSA